ncbi:hypothetical protein [Adhaeretor mobilis]|nr:hypothetical protein [Adhaeretor mobilis]
MRYLVKALVKPGKEQALLKAIDDGSLGAGSVAGGEYLRNMRQARLSEDSAARWVEVCYCAEPLNEELPYWEKFFDIVQIKDAHARGNCRDDNGTEPWACGNCDCTEKLEARLEQQGVSFIQALQEQVSNNSNS